MEWQVTLSFLFDSNVSLNPSETSLCMSVRAGSGSSLPSNKTFIGNFNEEIYVLDETPKKRNIHCNINNVFSSVPTFQS